MPTVLVAGVVGIALYDYYSYCAAVGCNNSGAAVQDLLNLIELEDFLPLHLRGLLLALQTLNDSLEAEEDLDDDNVDEEEEIYGSVSISVEI